jgi:hypothetical protein
VKKDASGDAEAGSLSAEEVLALEHRMERTERELRRFERLMKETPASAAHRGTAHARHRAGAA